MNLDPRNLKTDYMRFMIASVMAQWVFALYSAVDGMFVARGVSEVALSVTLAAGKPGFPCRLRPSRLPVRT